MLRATFAGLHPVPGRNSIVFRWATNGIHIVPRLALSNTSQGENTYDGPLGNLHILLVFTLSYWWSKIQLVLLATG